jgi:hypothetical protein
LLTLLPGTLLISNVACSAVPDATDLPHTALLRVAELYFGHPFATASLSPTPRIVTPPRWFRIPATSLQGSVLACGVLP